MTKNSSTVKEWGLKSSHESGAQEGPKRDARGAGDRPYYKSRWLILILGICAVLFARHAGKWLVVDAPEAADIIVVLAGETHVRPAYALELQRRGFAPKVMIDVPANADVFGVSEMELARTYVEKSSQPSSTHLCPIVGLSTRDESHDVERCLRDYASGRVLIVTSDFHTRRSLSIFRHELPGRHFSVAAARDDNEFGIRWWAHRQWAKTCLDEWLRLLWWQAIERWK